jgi:hypothetical protein
VKSPLIWILLIFWLYLAWSAFSRGNVAGAIVFLAIGGALTFYRIKRSSAGGR